MNMLANLKIDDSIVLEQEQDRIAGGNRTLDSDIYGFTIDAAYLGASKGGAAFVAFILKEKKTGNLFKPTIYVTSGKDKGYKPYFTKTDEATGKVTNTPLPGFLVANSIAELTTGVPLADQPQEEKIVKIYDFDAKAEKPTKVQMLVELLGKDINLGVIRQTVDKNKDNGSGVYVPTGETRDENEVDKVFCAREDFEFMTQTEIKAKRGGDDSVEAVFHKTWLEANKGKTRNKAKGASGAAGGVAKSGAGAAAAGKPKSGLFS